MKDLDVIAYATDAELLAAYRFACRCNQWKTARLIRLELATR
jgi:hypothetical protein